MPYSEKIAILRMRKGVPGVGRKLARYFNAYELTCGHKPAVKIPDNAVVINYGRSNWPVWYMEARQRGVRLLNQPSAVANSVDKRLTLELLSNAGVPCLDWSTDKAVAYDWYNNWTPVIIRHQVNGKKGNGIELADPEGDLSQGYNKETFPDAPLYTKHYDKDVEFRVHVVNGEVIDYVQKKRMGKKKREKLGLTDNDMLIRNHKRGWVFAHNDIIHSPLVKKLALDTVATLGLDYGGIDILAKTSDGEVVDAVVCESNSAPGMSSVTTFKAYVNAFEKLAGGNNV